MADSLLAELDSFIHELESYDGSESKDEEAVPRHRDCGVFSGRPGFGKPKLWYFPVKGRGWPLRVALFMGGIEFEDIREPPPKYFKGELQHVAPLGTLPVIQTDENETWVQTTAMLRYIGKHVGLYPQNPELQLCCDVAMEVVEDGSRLIGKTFPLKGDELIAARKELVDVKFPKYFKYLSGLLPEENEGGYLCGETLTVADLRVYQWLDWITMGVLDHIPTNLLDHWPKLSHLKRLVESHPKVREWNTQHEGKKPNAV